MVFIASSLILAAILNLPTHVYSATVSATVAQTFLGVGGSGAWWPHDLFSFPESARQNLSELLFSESGLAISSYRYNLGGGGVGVSNPVRAPETPYVSPGVYNFSADPEGVFFLQQASDFGVPGITMFVNSAPAPLTSNGFSCNGQFVNGTLFTFFPTSTDDISCVQPTAQRTQLIWSMSLSIGGRQGSISVSCLFSVIFNCLSSCRFCECNE